MLHDVAPGLLLGALALGAVHGAEPGHGWPVAAAYAFDRANSLLAGLAAGLVIGVGHLVSSLVVVGAFFLLKTRLDLRGLSEPLHVAGVPIGSAIDVFAGVLLILLGVREYRGGGHSHGDGEGHSHGHGDEHSHGHGHERGRPHDHDSHGGDATGPGRLHDSVRVAPAGGRGHSHDHPHHDRSRDGLLARLASALPFIGDEDGHSHDHTDHAHDGLSADEGLSGIAVSAFVLGFAHEEEFEIIAICAGTDHCLGLMLAYAGTVVCVITALTLLFVAGYERFEERMERYAEHFPAVSAAVLVLMGAGFVFGVF